MDRIENLMVGFGNAAWGMPLLVLLVGGGLFFSFYIKLLPYRYIGHAIDILRGKFDKKEDAGDISHYEALSTALAATVGMGNISGVAIAITMGGPGALFWMWISALVGVSTKFFTCTLAIMYRGKDSKGELQGGPMYFITEGLGKKWKPLAVVFCIAGMFGPLPVFNANQLTAAFNDSLFIPMGIEQSTTTNLIFGLGLAALVALVIFGGIKRIGKVASKLVPFMVVVYSAAVLYIIFSNFTLIDDCFALIFSDAFSGEAVSGGVIGAIIIAGVRRAAFSNEAGLGTAPMAHGAAKTDEPVREGLIAMMGPIIDTIIVCTMTALAIIITNSWQDASESGINITLNAFDIGLPGIGKYVLMLCILIFSLTSMFSLSYYGSKCFSFLFGAEYKNIFNVFYICSIIAGSVASLSAIIGFIDGMYAIMAVPTMLSAILLAPKVKAAANDYFKRMKAGGVL
ncbi:alanine/glycine:cation symporter family protein [Portibacter lacus]|uniref:Sodium:alanine symporter n=1 Tax=Portibacter lacus TaxID=1099794 RepID=A0AA37WEZ1_9BACT|nr:alanine/glycine:cation symporter family protein [Portibacter lacus]GLR17982.1 sodium:alanine symporter [Portibacter lacus]